MNKPHVAQAVSAYLDNLPKFNPMNREPGIHCFGLFAVDFWDGWYPLDGLDASEFCPDAMKFPIKQFWEFVKEFFPGHELGWEGDVRSDSIYIALVNGKMPTRFKDFIIGWKQENNGSTFMACASCPPIDLSEVDIYAPSFVKVVGRDELMVVEDEH